MALSPAERERYSRHLLLPEIGAAGQEKLKAARVLVIGAGGLGSPASLYLAAAGVGTLGVVDHDRVELSNLQRQLLFDTAGVGASKAMAARARLGALNPEIEVVAHELRLDAGNALELLRGYDLVLDGSDRLATRYLVNDACVLLARPLVSAAIHRFEGQAMSYVPGAGPCYRCLFAESAEDAVPNCAEAGVLGVLPGMLGALQATEAIKLLLGIGEPLVGRLMTFDALAMQWREFRFARRPDCAVCGAHPSITSLAGHARAGDAPSFERIGPRQLHALWASAIGSGRQLTIVDVREPREFAFGHLQGALNIPLAELPRRWSGIPLEFPVVFACRSGARSLRACELAAKAGISSPIQLEGGLLAWAALVDPGLQVAPVE
jgi:molybdopterin/thiamine biosynthesis adenylyltransferase/rhodanese-related sulfurtransferase